MQIKEQYVFIIPQYCGEGQKTEAFLLSYPNTLEKCQSYSKTWAVFECCQKEDIKIIQCYIPEKELEEFREQGTYCTQDVIDEFIKQNKEYKKRISLPNQSLFKNTKNSNYTNEFQDKNCIP